MAETWTYDDSSIGDMNGDVFNQYMADQATDSVLEASDLVTTKFNQDVINVFIAKHTTYDDGEE